MSNLDKVENSIGYKFKNRALLERALTHSSYANSHRNMESYDRLEFLGDAVLSFVAADILYKKYPDMNEGEMTDRRKRFVSMLPLKQLCIKLGVDKEIKTNSALGDKMQSDVMESILAAVYIDGGIEEAIAFVWKLRDIVYEIVGIDGIQKDISDYKSAVNQKYPSPHVVQYKEIGKTGPEHAPTFAVELWIDGEKRTEATGSNKKHAEQACAKLLLEEKK